MISFESDYTTGAHPEILQRLFETNLEPQPGYGEDAYCRSAKQKIRQALCDEQAEIFFLSGGTQTNAIAASALLQPWQGVLAAQTGHIHGHEAGAIEAMGRKVLALPEHLGKLDPGELADYLAAFYGDENREHLVWPGVVYLSHPTEWGTLYSKQELADISALCRKYDLKLFLDGARLGYALASSESDVTLQDLGRLCDAFYIGGTKVGALCGEAAVFPRGGMPPHFMNWVKKHGGLLAKGRLLGVQFDALFTNELYARLGQNGIDRAVELKRILARHGVPFYLETPTNQQFVVLPDRVIHSLEAHGIRCGFWSKPDPEHTVVRFATSWSTTPEDLTALDAALGQTI